MPYGQNGTIAISFQNSYGTSLTDSKYWIPITNEDANLGIEDLVSEERRGIYDEGGSYHGKESIEGSLNIDFNMETLLVCLKAAMGDPTTTTSADLKSHVFQPRTSDYDTAFAANQPFSYIKDLDDAGSAQVYYDMVATGVTIGVANGDFYKLTLPMMGGKYTHEAPSAASYATDSNYTWDATSISLDGAGNSDFEEITFTIDENLETIYVMDGTRTPSHVKRAGVRTVTVAGTLLFNDQTALNDFKSQNQIPLILTAQAGHEVQSGYSEEVKLDCPAFRYTAYPVGLSDAGQIRASFEGKAKYHSGSGTAIEITVVTTHAAA